MITITKVNNVIYTLLGRRETAIPDITDIQNDHAIQEDEKAVTTLSLPQPEISRKYALDSIL